MKIAKSVISNSRRCIHSGDLSTSHKRKASELFTTGGKLEFLGPSFYNNQNTLQLPAAVLTDPIRPEVAFIGASNVGKSSLIKALLNDTDDLVRTSRRPGHTKSLNFFRIASGRVTLVDMPGYGRNSQQEWGQMVVDYLKTRRNLSRVYLLRELSRAFSPDDSTVISMLREIEVPFQLILTKCDLFPRELESFRSKVVKDAGNVFDDNPCFVSPIIQCSSRPYRNLKQHEDDQHVGIDELRISILHATGVFKQR